MNDVKLIVLDVDGTLTDGGIFYTESGDEIKQFNVKDAIGILACEAVGKKCMVLTGRKSAIVERRAQDLHIEYVYQKVGNKELFLKEFMDQKGYCSEDVLYIGDDLNDFLAMKICGKVGCPADAAKEVIDIADYISNCNGGKGAVREILLNVLREEGKYEQAIKILYGNCVN